MMEASCGGSLHHRKKLISCPKMACFVAKSEQEDYPAFGLKVYTTQLQIVVVLH